MTEPLVPAEVDLRGYDYMPFYGHHLFGSDFNAKVSDAEWRAAVTLWWAAWNQVPAASLPNDDTALCRLADLGRDLKTFKKLKANALHGFVECSDGRLYHRQLSKWAIDAWDLRQESRDGKERLKRHRKERSDLFRQLRELGETPSFETPIATLREMLLKRSQHDGGNVSGNALATARKEGKRSEANGSDISNRDVGVTPTIPGPPQADATGNSAVENIGESKAKVNGAGMRLDDPKYIADSSVTVERPRREGESYEDWRDAVITLIQQRQARGRAHA
jgi:hypothetical protein